MSERLDETGVLSDTICMRLYQKDVKTVNDFFDADFDELRNTPGLGPKKMYELCEYEKNRLLNESRATRQ